jgi:hypothetical protein
VKLCCMCKLEKPIAQFWNTTRINRCKDCDKRYNRTKHRETAKQKIVNAINKLGGKCACCGETTVEFLTFDHMNGRITQKGFNNYRVAVSVLRGESDIRVLCMNCNHSYGVRGYCPHRLFGRFGSFSPTRVRKALRSDLLLGE